MKKYIIATERAPKAIGPYSQAVGFGNLLFLSGQIALDPDSQQMVDGCVENQTRRIMENITAVLEAANLGLENVVKSTVYLANMNDFAEFNAAYGKYFQEHPPARSTVEVSRLPKNALVEVEVIAAFPTENELPDKKVDAEADEEESEAQEEAPSEREELDPSEDADKDADKDAPSAQKES